MNKLYIILLSLILTNINAQSVGITNPTETPTIPYTFPHNSASLDTYFSQRGILIPQYDLQELTNPASPVDFTEDISNGKYVDGTLIFNYGNTFIKGYYLWVKDTWHLVLYKGTEPQQLSIKIPAETPILKANSGTDIQVLQGWEIAKNNISNAQVSNNSITLPAGKYSYKYAVDLVVSGAGSGAYFGNFDAYSISTFLRKSDGTPITSTQRATKISGSDDGEFLFYEGLFVFELDEPTTIQQTFQYSDGTTNYNGAVARTEFYAMIYHFNN